MRIHSTNDTSHLRRAVSGVRRLTTLVAIGAAVVAGLTVPAALGAGAHASSGARVVSSDFNKQVLHYTNVERKKRGLRPLRAASCPRAYANRHTKRLANQGRLYHQNLRPVLRSCRARVVGENVAYRGSANARAVVKSWMRSKGHRANILRPGHRHLGIGAYRAGGRVYVGQVFSG